MTQQAVYTPDSPSPSPPPSATDDSASVAERAFFFVREMLCRHWPIGLVFAGALAVFLPALILEYEWGYPDDMLVYATNPHIKPPTLTGLWELVSQPQFLDYNPVAWAAVWAQSWVCHPENPLGFRIVSLLLHLFNIWLVWRLIPYFVPGRPMLAVAVAWGFAIHPLNVEPVIWPSAQSWVISTTLGLCVLHLFWRHASAWDGKRPGAKPPKLPVSVGALVCLVAGLFAKPGIIILPPLLFLMDWLVRRRTWWRAAVWTLPYFVVGVGVGAASHAIFSKKLHIGYPGGSLPMSVATHLPAILDNFKNWFVPLKVKDDGTLHMSLGFFYHTSVPQTDAEIGWSVACALIGLAGLGALWWIAGRTRVAMMAALWFLGGQALFSGIFQNQWWRQADRYNYLCGLGLILLVMLAASALWNRYGQRLPHALRVRTALIVAVVAAYGAMASVQRSMWADWDTFRESQRIVAPHSPRVIFGDALDSAGTIIWNLGNRPLDASPLKLPEKAPNGAPWTFDPRLLDRVMGDPKEFGYGQRVRAFALRLIADHHVGPAEAKADLPAREAELKRMAHAAPQDLSISIWTAIAFFAIDKPELAMPFAQRVTSNPRVRWAELAARSAEEWEGDAGWRLFVAHGDFPPNQLLLYEISPFLRFYPRGLVALGQWYDADEALRIANFLFPTDKDFSDKYADIRSRIQLASGE